MYTYNTYMCVCVQKPESKGTSRGARPSVTTLANEAMSLKGKHVRTLSCAPAKFELISGPVYDLLIHWLIAQIVSRPTCTCPFGIQIHFISRHDSYIVKSCRLHVNM